jgi:SRSO17 transposase
MARLSDHLTDYQSIFRNRTKVCFDKAELYTQGIIKSNMHNIECISEESGTNYHQMQHFITESNWNGREVIDKVAKDVSTSLRKFKLTGMVIAESGLVKKDDKS